MKNSLGIHYSPALTFIPFIVVFSVFVPSLSWADVEIGASAIAYGGLIALGMFLIPWISEAVIYSLYLPARFRDALLPSFLANLVSSFVGFLIYGILGAITVKTLLYLTELIMSILIEYPIVRPFFKDFDRSKRWRAVILANVVSYILLLVFIRVTKFGRI